MDWLLQPRYHEESRARRPTVFRWLAQGVNRESNDMEQRVALVTGASRGIGRGIALELARCGCAVVVNYAGNEAAARETAAACRATADGARAEICQADISQAADRERLIVFTRERFGRLDLL